MSNLEHALLISGLIVGIFWFVASLIIGAILVAEEKYKAAVMVSIVAALSTVLLNYCFLCLSSGEL